MHAILAPRYALSTAPGYAMRSAPRDAIPGMKTVEEVRRQRLQMLRDEYGTLAALNEKLELGKRDSTLSQYLNQSTGTKTSKPKVMGSPMARRLEQVCGKEVGWMDTDPDLEEAAAAYRSFALQILAKANPALGGGPITLAAANLPLQAHELLTKDDEKRVQEKQRRQQLQKEKPRKTTKPGKPSKPAA